MTPYYTDGQVTIYHGDSREILPALPDVAAIVTDPPYGISLKTSFSTSKRNYPNGKNHVPLKAYAPVHGDDKPYDPTWLLGYPEVLLWGANHYARLLPDGGQWLVWDKRCGIVPPRSYDDCEIAWHNKKGRARIFRHLWDGMVRASEMGEQRQHPTQKPLKLMRWCLGFVTAKSICDPYMGSGTTLRAAKDLGVRAIGIELEEKYCEIAAGRMAQECLSLSGANSQLNQPASTPNALPTTDDQRTRQRVPQEGSE